MVRFVSGLVLKCVARLHVEGLDNLPKDGGFIGAVNHLSSFDPLPVLSTFPVRPVTIFAAIEHRNDFIAGWALDRLGAIWIDRNEPGRDALRIAINELKQGTVMGIAPEGTRSKTGALQAGKTGAAYLATRANVPIVPAVVWGTEKIKRNIRRLQRTDVYLRFGELIHLPAGRADAQKLDEYTDLIMRRMAAMLPPEYRGVYADAVKE
jgi:1-acyl-sn-glycerol-3-phosphate acyltransferase